MGLVDFASDTIQDKLLQQQACDERLDIWMRREQSTLQRLSASGKVTSGSRSGFSAAIQLVLELLRALKPQDDNVPGADLFEAAQLIDLSARKVALGRNPAEDMARALACWTVSLKLATGNTSALRKRNRQLLVDRASVLSTQLGGGAICWEDVKRCEVELMMEGCDCLSMPTVANWLEAFVTRFDVCTGGAFAATLARATSLGKTWALMAVMQLRIGERHGPRAIAQGLGAIVAVFMGIVRMEELFAHCEDTRTSTDMLEQVFKQSNAQVGKTTLPAKEAKAALEYALSLDFQALSDLARDILEVLCCQFWQRSRATGASK